MQYQFERKTLHDESFCKYELKSKPNFKKILNFLQYIVQWSLYFKIIHGTKKMWSCIAGGLKIKVI